MGKKHKIVSEDRFAGKQRCLQNFLENPIKRQIYVFCESVANIFITAVAKTEVKVNLSVTPDDLATLSQL